VCFLYEGEAPTLQTLKGEIQMAHNDSKKHPPEHHSHSSVEHVHPAPQKGHMHGDSIQGKHPGSSSRSHPDRDRNAMHDGD
jgi:hypothetical protein